MKTLKILIADDHQVTREGIKQILLLQKGFLPEIDEAKNGSEAINLAKQFGYDIIIMDIQMPETDGIEATEAILRIDQNARILALSMFDEKHYILSIIRAGAMGYILKNTGAEEIIKAVETVANGKKYFSSEVSLTMMEPFLNDILSHEPSNPIDYKRILSKREKEILKIMINEADINIISERLNISRRTVENHKYRMMEKLGVKNSVELIRLAIAEKIV